MIRHVKTPIGQLKKMIYCREITFAGNDKLKIYGTLSCSSGKRMKIENRVFFKNETEAIQHGFRPCGHCLHDEYLLWRTKL